MSARAPRWEVCKSDAGYWVRFRSSNGQIIVSSETYGRKRAALRAVALVAGELIEVRVLQRKPMPIDEMPIQTVATGLARDVEVRDLT